MPSASKSNKLNQAFGCTPCIMRAPGKTGIFERKGVVAMLRDILLRLFELTVGFISLADKVQKLRIVNVLLEERLKRLEHEIKALREQSLK